MKVSVLLCAGHKGSEDANLVGVSRTTVSAIKKHTDDGEGVDRHKAVFERLLRILTACGRPFEAYIEWFPESCHNPQQSFDHGWTSANTLWIKKAA